MKLYQPASLMVALFATGSCFAADLNPTVTPVAETPAVPGDADDMVLWTDAKKPERSLIIGNDKKAEGALYLYAMDGTELAKTDTLNRPVNVDLRYGISIGDETYDIVAVPLRGTNEIRVFKVNGKKSQLVDITTEGGIETGFVDTPYGFSLYKRPSDGALFGFVSSKRAEAINQIRFEDDGDGKVKGTVVRAFGGADIQTFVEGICVDDALGYVYCADETQGILKYHADPEADGSLISVFAKDDGIIADREGVTLYESSETEGYLLLSSQGDGTIKVYDRQGDNRFLGTIHTLGSTKTDGIAVTSRNAGPGFAKGALVCHNDQGSNYVIYGWDAIEGAMAKFTPAKETSSLTAEASQCSEEEPRHSEPQ